MSGNSSTLLQCRNAVNMPYCKQPYVAILLVATHATATAMNCTRLECQGCTVMSNLPNYTT